MLLFTGGGGGCILFSNLILYDWVHVMFARLMSEKCGRQNLLRMGMPCLWPQELQGILYSVDGSVWSCCWWYTSEKTESIDSLLGLGKLMLLLVSNHLSMFPTGKVDGITHKCFQILEVMMSQMVLSLPNTPLLLDLVLNQKLQLGTWGDIGIQWGSG